MSNQEIVPPEPHSMGGYPHAAWNYLPRWLRVVLFLVLVAVAIFVVTFFKS
jgi:hypothetical protein